MYYIYIYIYAYIYTCTWSPILVKELVLGTSVLTTNKSAIVVRNIVAERLMRSAKSSFSKMNAAVQRERESELTPAHVWERINNRCGRSLHVKLMIVVIAANKESINWK